IINDEYGGTLYDGFLGVLNATPGLSQIIYSLAGVATGIYSSLSGIQWNGRYDICQNRENVWKVRSLHKNVDSKLKKVPMKLVSVKSQDQTSILNQQIDEIRQHGWEDLFEDTKSFCIQYNIIVPNMLDTTTARGRSRGRGVATASVERAFLSMNIIKTELRNKTGDKWLNHRMVCYIERDIFTSIDDAKILDYFQGMRTRRVNLPRTS
ncbi:hypothetical protein ACJX0J_027319, partial [Zea mays]